MTIILTGIIDNIKNAVGGNWPVGYLVRDILDEEKDYDDVVNMLSGSDIISPTYFSISGTQKDEGCIIARSARNVIFIRKLSDSKVLIQTNADNPESVTEEDNILYSSQRYKLAKNINTKYSLYELFDKSPIINTSTLYISYMSCKEFILESNIPNTKL